MENLQKVEWLIGEVVSPHTEHPLPIVTAKNIPYIPNGNRLQNLSIYLPKTKETSLLVGRPITSIPGLSPFDGLPRWHVYIYGGAWRDPYLTSASIEPAVAHAFSASSVSSTGITAVISIDYNISPFPKHPTAPYDVINDRHSDPAREAKHPDHILDVLNGLKFLHSLGLSDDSYIFSGHSAGACLAFQSILQTPQHWGLEDLNSAPRPVAILGLNGLYDLPGLVNDLGTSHVHLKVVYDDLLGIAFGPDQSTWSFASPEYVQVADLAGRVKEGFAPRLIVLDQSEEDQLVPVSQADKLEQRLKGVDGLRVVRGHRCVGEHAAPWKEGNIIWDSIQDILTILSNECTLGLK